MIYATGDTHENFRRFETTFFPEQAEMTKDDYVIICGDFGGLWDGRKEEQKTLDWLETRPFTTLFVGGNHENYELLTEYPIEEWHGGKAQHIRPHVIHLMRGQIYDIAEHKFFTMGGARSHDIQDGILEPDSPDFKDRLDKLRARDARFRINHISWWKEEMPADSEYEEAKENLEKVSYKVDYIISHCAPNSVQDIISNGTFSSDKLTNFFESVKQKSDFHYWLFGHYHDNRIIGRNFVLLWEQIVRVI